VETINSYRTDKGLRVLQWALMLPFCLFMAVLPLFAAPRQSGDRITFLLIAVVAWAGSVLITSGPRLEVSDAYVVIVNPLHTRFVARDGVLEFGGTRFLTVTSGRREATYTVWAVQASNARILSGRPTRVTRVAAELNQMVNRSAASGAVDRVRATRPSIALWIGLALIVGTWVALGRIR
jgi:hypothetical protein